MKRKKRFAIWKNKKENRKREDRCWGRVRVKA